MEVGSRGNTAPQYESRDLKASAEEMRAGAREAPAQRCGCRWRAARAVGPVPARTWVLPATARAEPSPRRWGCARRERANTH